MTNKLFVLGTILSTGEKEYFQIKDIPSFICTHGYFSDLEITTLDGVLIANTFGIFLNKILPNVRQLIIEDLVAMQTGVIEISENYTVTLEEATSKNK